MINICYIQAEPIQCLFLKNFKVFDPNGGSFKEGKYYHSFYSEIADVIERFFYDVKIIDKPEDAYQVKKMNF